MRKYIYSVIFLSIVFFKLFDVFPHLSLFDLSEYYDYNNLKLSSFEKIFYTLHNSFHNYVPLMISENPELTFQKKCKLGTKNKEKEQVVKSNKKRIAGGQQSECLYAQVVR